jgi:hypothetical protein
LAVFNNPQLWIPDCIPDAAQTRIPLIVHAAVLQPGARELVGPQKRPDLLEAPVDDGVHAHKVRPAAVGAVEEGQVLAVRVRAARADEDGLDVPVLGEVEGKGVAEGDGLGVDVRRQREVVAARRGGDEGGHGGEGVGGPRVDGGDGGGERVGFSAVEAREVGVQGGEVEDQEDEAVFAAIVREG